MQFHEAFNQFIINQKIIKSVSYPAYGDYSKPYNERFYGDGIEVENGYKYISFGGGCSGEDCNTSFIISPNDTIVSSCSW